MSYYDRLTWSDIAYQEQHGHLPDKGWTADYVGECLASGDDPDELYESIRAVEDQRMHDRIAELERENQALRDALNGSDAA